MYYAGFFILVHRPVNTGQWAKHKHPVLLRECRLSYLKSGEIIMKLCITNIIKLNTTISFPDVINSTAVALQQKQWHLKCSFRHFYFLRDTSRPR
jgi:hypothetical protein